MTRTSLALVPLVLLLAALAVARTAAAQGRPAAPPASAGTILREDPRLDALVPPGARLEKIAEHLAWTEGPVWDRRAGHLLFSDIPRNLVLRWREGEGVSTFLTRSGYSGAAPFPGREPGSNGLAFDREGRLVLCEHGDRRVTRLEADGRRTVLADRYEGRRLNSPNDVVVASDGDLYFTDPPYGLPGTFTDPAKELPFQGVYRLGADGTLTLLTRELSAPNGIALSPDERTLYVSNSDGKRPIWMAYPLRTDDTLGPGRVLADASRWAGERPGAPDGLTVDRAGNLFASGPGGVYVLAPDGTHLGTIVTGVPTSNVAWGEDGSTLFVTANHEVHRIRLTTRGAGF